MCYYHLTPVVQWPLTTGHSKEGLGLGESMYQTSNFGSALMVLATVIFIHLCPQVKIEAFGKYRNAKKLLKHFINKILTAYTV